MSETSLPPQNAPDARKFMPVQIPESLLSRRVLVMDGGLATSLEQCEGADLSKSALWSSALLASNPSAIARVHDRFLAAGADIIATCSYQCHPRLYDSRAACARDLRRALALALDARARAGRDTVVVALSCGPYGATLANGAEYTGDYAAGVSQASLEAFHRDRVAMMTDALRELAADRSVPNPASVAWLFETIPNKEELAAIAAMYARADREMEMPDAIVSMQCRDAETIADGTPLANAVEALVGSFPKRKLLGVGVNCVGPDIVLGCMKTIRDAIRCATDSGYAHAIRIVLYPNSGEQWVNREWVNVNNKASLELWQQYVEAWLAFAQQNGEQLIIGGCCRTGPEHIKSIRAIVQEYELKSG